MSYLDMLEAPDVKSVDDLIEYTRSRFGVVVTWKEKAIFKGNLRKFLADNPHLGSEAQAMTVMVKAVNWGKDARKKCTNLHGVFYLVAFARAAGALPELDPDFVRRSEVEDAILGALAVETDDGWRTRLICSEGPARVRTLSEWRQKMAAA